MRTHLLGLVLLCSFSLLAHAETPTLNAVDAANIAQRDLESRDIAGTVYIAELRYKESKLLGTNPPYWEVLWSKEFDAQTPGRKEIGLKIKMDGSFTRTVR